MKSEPIRLTLEAAAREFAASKETLRRGLKGLDLETGRGKTYDLATIYRALAGDVKSERARLLRTQANLLEMDLATRRADTLSMIEARAAIARLFQPMREQLLELPNAWCTRVNPSDPALAREALGQWVDQCLAAVNLDDRRELK
jgi:hypothetical protein